LIAVYLRKSRDEGEFEDVLSKHRDTLLALVNNRNWSYRLYEEVASGEKIESRKEMQKLLHHVEDKMYDGVVVMDIDRLGRGENKDWALIKDTFLYIESRLWQGQRQRQKAIGLYSVIMFIRTVVNANRKVNN